MKISTYISQIVASCEQEKELSNGAKYNFKETIQRINKYVNSEFYERVSDAIFWNINTTRIINFAKSIDLDTKNFRPEGQGDINFVQSWILKLKFTKWLRDARIAILLNDLSEGLAIYGSIIWKLVDGEEGKELEEVDLQNIYFDPLTESLEDTPKVEKHYLTAYELMEKKDVWNGVDEVIASYKEKDPFHKFCIDEFWGPFSEEGEQKFYHCIVYGEGDKEIKLFEEYPSEDEDPYYDFHIGRYRGTWMRVGVVERLFDLQERVNQIVNENATSTSIASLLLLRSSDPNTAGANVLDQAISGQIIQSSDLQQIGIDNRTLNNFLQEMQMIETHADRLCHTPDIIQGEKMPSGATFRGTELVARAALSTFEYIRQRVGEKIGYLMLEKILPSLAKTWNKSDIIQIAQDEQDIQIYDDYVFRIAKIHKMNQASAENRVASQEELDGFAQQQVDMIKERKMEIPSKFFNFDYGITMNVTGENQDRAQQNDAYANALNMVQANPAIIDVPLFKQYLENNGISYFKMSKYAKEQLQSSAQAMHQGSQAANVPLPPQGQPLGNLQPTQNQLNG